jgi:zinc-ribbon domain
MPAVECPSCGAEVAEGTELCPDCGSRLAGSDGLAARVRTYWSSPDAGLLVGVGLAAAGAVLLAVGLWIWGAVGLVLAGLVFLLRWKVGRRGAGAALTRLSAERRVVGARSRGQLELFRLRRELAELHAELNGAYQELGRATHAGEEAAAGAATSRVDAVTARLGAKQAQIDAQLGRMRERVRQAQETTGASNT